MSSELDDLRRERDQYAAAINHLITTVRYTAHHWLTTLPDTIRTADVAKALNDFAREVPTLPEDLRDDLWQRIVGAYYLVFENDGHPEDSTAAANAAMRVIQPELDRLLGKNTVLLAAAERVRALHQPVQHMGKTWCGECSVRRSTGPRSEEWAAFIPYPCPTIDALDHTPKETP